MTSKEFKIRLASGSISWRMRVDLAKDTSTSKEILIILSEDECEENDYIKAKVAENPNTPKEILTKLSKYPWYVVKGWVAGNINTPKEVLIELSKNKEWYIRCRVAKNPSTPLEILKILSKDKHGNVRFFVPQNPSWTP